MVMYFDNSHLLDIQNKEVLNMALSIMAAINLSTCNNLRNTEQIYTKFSITRISKQK
jgi:hypothetical protein